MTLFSTSVVSKKYFNTSRNISRPVLEKMLIQEKNNSANRVTDWLEVLIGSIADKIADQHEAKALFHQKQPSLNQKMKYSARWPWKWLVEY